MRNRSKVARKNALRCGEMAKPAQPHAVVLGDARVTIKAIAARVFEALTDADRLGTWWGEDVRVDAQVGGLYEATLTMGRVEGTIIAIDGPGKLTFAWPLPHEGGTVVTSVAYMLTPRGDQTGVQVIHHAPRSVPGDWNGLWRPVLEALKAYVEGSGTQPISD